MGNWWFSGWKRLEIFGDLGNYLGMPDYTHTYRTEMLERRPRSVDNSRWAEGVSVCLYKGDKLTDGDKMGIMQVYNYAAICSSVAN